MSPHFGHQIRPIILLVLNRYMGNVRVDLSGKDISQDMASLAMDENSTGKQADSDRLVEYQSYYHIIYQFIGSIKSFIDRLYSSIN